MKIKEMLFGKKKEKEETKEQKAFKELYKENQKILEELYKKSETA